MITEDMIRDAIEDCIWKHEVGGVDICTGMCAPCLNIIDKGQCDAIRELVRKDKENKNV